MDPNANLAEQRRIIARNAQRTEPDRHDLERLADLAEALDDWLTRGGFLPEAWKR